MGLITEEVFPLETEYLEWVIQLGPHMKYLPHKLCDILCLLTVGEILPCGSRCLLWTKLHQSGFYLWSAFLVPFTLYFPWISLKFPTKRVILIISIYSDLCQRPSLKKSIVIFSIFWFTTLNVFWIAFWDSLSPLFIWDTLFAENIKFQVP